MRSVCATTDMALVPMGTGRYWPLILACWRPEPKARRQTVTEGTPESIEGLLLELVH